MAELNRRNNKAKGPIGMKIPKFVIPVSMVLIVFAPLVRLFYPFTGLLGAIAIALSILMLAGASAWGLESLKPVDPSRAPTLFRWASCVNDKIMPYTAVSVICILFISGFYAWKIGSPYFFLRVSLLSTFAFTIIVIIGALMDRLSRPSLAKITKS